MIQQMFTCPMKMSKNYFLPEIFSFFTANSTYCTSPIHELTFILKLTNIPKS